MRQTAGQLVAVARTHLSTSTEISDARFCEQVKQCLHAANRAAKRLPLGQLDSSVFLEPRKTPLITTQSPFKNAAIQ